MKIAFYKANTGKLVDIIINMWTGCYGYSHCEIVCSADSFINAVRFKNIDIYSNHWTVFDVPEVDTIEKEQEIYHLMKSLQGAKYDWFGIVFSFVFGFIHKQKDDQWWCSEICGYVLKETVLPNLKFRVSPNKLAKLLGHKGVKFND